MNLPSSPSFLARPPVVVISAALLVLGWPLALAAIIGDQSSVSAAEDPDYFARPLPSGLIFVLGVSASILVIASLVTLVLATRRHSMRSLWWWVIGPLMVIGSIGAYAYRIATARVIGANIGAGLVIIFGGLFSIMLLVWCVAWSIYLLRGTPAPKR